MPHPRTLPVEWGDERHADRTFLLRFPALQRVFLLGSVCAGALASTAVFAQQSATAGQTVQITLPNCTAATCFVATGANALLWSDASTAINVTPNGVHSTTLGLSATNGGTIRLDGGGNIQGNTAMLADNGTIEANGALTLAQDRLIQSRYFVVAQNGGRITLNGPTSIGGAFLSVGMLANTAGSTITVNGALNATLNDTQALAYAQDGGHISLTGGGTITATGSSQNLTILTADGQSRPSTIDATGITASATDPRMTLSGVQTVDAGTVNIKNSTFDIGAGLGSAGIYVREGLNTNLGGTVNLDNSKFAMSAAAGPVVKVTGTKGSQINVTNGSSLTAFNGASGDLMLVGYGQANNTGADVSLHATDSTLTGKITVDAPYSVSDPNHLTLALDGATRWTGDLNVASGSNAAATIGGSSLWTGTTSGASGIGVTVQDTGTWQVTGQPSGLDSLSLNGGTVRAGVNNLALTSPITVNGGGTFDTQNYAMTVSGALAGAGTLSKTGAGTLTQTGNSAGFGGVTAVKAGTLLVNGTLGGTVNVASGGALGGTGTVAGDTTVASGGALIGRQGQVLNFGGDLTLASGSNVNVSLGTPESTGLFNVAGNLTLDGRVNVTDLGGFSPGIYRLFDYTGALTDNGIDVGTVPSSLDASALTVQTAPGQVNLVNASGVDLAFWDGSNNLNHNNNAVDGGNGSWNDKAGWTESNGALNGRWTDGNFAIFMGQPGKVTVDGPVAIAGMQFAVDGYRIEGGPINLERPETIIRTGAGGQGSANVTATIASELTGSGGLTKTDYGTLTLTGNNTYQGGTVVHEGTLQIGDGGASGSITGNVTVRNTATLAFNRSDALTFNGTIQGAGSLTQAGTGTTVLTAANTYTGDTLIKSGTLAVNGSITSPTTIAQAGTLAGNGTVFGKVDNYGRIAPGNMGTLTIAGGYTGHGGVYQVQSALGDSNSPSDRLVINGGAADGSTNVQVTNVGGAGAATTGYGIPVVTVANGGVTTSNAFTLAAPVAAGPYEYQLYRGSDFGATGPDSNNWYLSSTTPPDNNPQPLYRPEAPVFAAAPGVARELSMALLGTYHERVGDSLPSGDAPPASSGAAPGNAANTKGAWGRWIGEARTRGYGGELNARTQSNITGLQVGTDLYTRGGDAGQPEDRIGGFFTYGQTDSNVHGFALGQQDYDSGNIGLDSYSLGATWTRRGASGWYLDGVVMGTRYTGSLQSHRGSRASVDGYGLTTSLEAGYPIALTPNVTLEPQAQLIWQYANLDSTKDDYSSVGFSAGSAFAARVGARLSSSFELGRTVLKPSLTTNLWQQFNPKDKVDFSGTTLSSGGQDTTAVEFVGGLSAQVSKRVGLWSTVSYLTGIAGPNQSGWRGNVGVRITW